MLKVVHDAEASNENAAGASLLDEIVRDGARAMLAEALQVEVAAYIDAHADEVDEAGHRLVVRNGHRQAREVTTAAGAVSVRAPRVNDKRIDEEDRGASTVRLVDPAGVGAEVPAGHRGAAVCCTCMGCPRVTLCPRWSSSSAPPRGCRHRRSPGSRAAGEKGILVERPDESGGDQQVA